VFLLAVEHYQCEKLRWKEKNVLKLQGL